ncbi:11911_t:CDS:2, partial [Diversispora eburnea]
MDKILSVFQFNFKSFSTQHSLQFTNKDNNNILNNYSCQTCQTPCSIHPSYPSNLKIDYKSPLKDTIQPYSKHVIISTGNKDWSKVIELDEGNLASELFKLQIE